MPPVPVTTLLLAFAGAVFLFVSLWLLVTWWMQRGQQRIERIRPTEDSDPTIVLDDLYAAGGRFGSWERLRRAAAERVERAELGLTLTEGVAIVLFCGVILAAAVFFWRYEEEESWMAIPAFLPTPRTCLELGVRTSTQRWR